MSAIMERLDRGSWDVIGKFLNSSEALRLLPSTARVLGCSVRLRDYDDIGSEPLPRGVVCDHDSFAGDVLRFTPR